jgi:hypothetical protein
VKSTSEFIRVNRILTSHAFCVRCYGLFAIILGASKTPLAQVPTEAAQENVGQGSCELSVRGREDFSAMDEVKIEAAHRGESQEMIVPLLYGRALLCRVIRRGLPSGVARHRRRGGRRVKAIIEPHPWLPYVAPFVLGTANGPCRV